jgi:hypothetical protein
MKRLKVYRIKSKLSLHCKLTLALNILTKIMQSSGSSSLYKTQKLHMSHKRVCRRASHKCDNTIPGVISHQKPAITCVLGMSWIRKSHREVHFGLLPKLLNHHLFLNKTRKTQGKVCPE